MSVHPSPPRPLICEYGENADPQMLDSLEALANDTALAIATHLERRLHWPLVIDLVIAASDWLADAIEGADGRLDDDEFYRRCGVRYRKGVAA